MAKYTKSQQKSLAFSIRNKAFELYKLNRISTKDMDTIHKMMMSVMKKL